jgi:putative glutamine amidotransferase
VTAPLIGLTVGRLRGADGRLLDAASHEYAEAVVAAGGLPLLLPSVPAALAAGATEHIDGLILTGGGDVDPGLYHAERAPETDGVDPGRDAAEVALVGAALERRLPVLAICRGAQLLNVALGGSLHQHLARLSSLSHDEWDHRREPVHRVRLAPASLVARVTGSTSLEVNSVHHQGLDRLGQGLQSAGYAEDDLVEAAEDGDRRLVAVQWHPELILDVPGSRQLFEWLVASAAANLRPLCGLQEAL